MNPKWCLTAGNNQPRNPNHCISVQNGEGEDTQADYELQWFNNNQLSIFKISQTIFQILCKSLSLSLTHSYSLNKTNEIYKKYFKPLSSILKWVDMKEYKNVKWLRYLTPG